MWRQQETQWPPPTCQCNGRDLFDVICSVSTDSTISHCTVDSEWLTAIQKGIGFVIKDAREFFKDLSENIYLIWLVIKQVVIFVTTV